MDSNVHLLPDQAVEKKQNFIGQIMSSKSPVRSCEDVDETALSYAEIKALCAGNPLIAEKMNLDVEVAKLRMLKANHQSQHYRLEDDLLKRYPEQIATQTAIIAGIEADAARYAAEKDKTAAVEPTLEDGAALTATPMTTANFPGMTIKGVEYTEKEPAAKALLEACKGVTDKNEVVIGSYMGFSMSIQINGLTNGADTYKLLLRGALTYQSELGTDAFGNITRINNVLADFPKRLENAKAQLNTLYIQQEEAKQELEKPFALADELAEKETRLALLNADLNIEGSGGMDVQNDPTIRDDIGAAIVDLAYERESAKSARPSILDEIRSFGAGKLGKSTETAGRKKSELEI